MVSSIVDEREDEEMAQLFASDSEGSEFEGFDLDEMPLNFLAQVHHGRENNERISDNEDDLDVLLDEENGDGNDVEDESTEENDQEWGENFIRQTEFPFNESIGPVKNLPQDKKPIDFFKLFFTDRLYRLIVHETNRYAKQEQQCLGKHFSWKELTINEFKTWLGIYYMMGIVQKPSLHSYWEKKQSYPNTRICSNYDKGLLQIDTSLPSLCQQGRRTPKRSSKLRSTLQTATIRSRNSPPISAELCPRS